MPRAGEFTRKSPPNVRYAHLVGQKFGRWTVLSISRRKIVRAKNDPALRRDFRYWPGTVRVRCECGHTGLRLLATLKAGKSKGCLGCFIERTRTPDA
jgi:hypothetical protein